MNIRHNLSADQRVTSTLVRLTKNRRRGRIMADRQVTAAAAAYQCRTCERMFAADDFYVSNKTQCKECVKARVRERARTNPAVQAYDRARAKLPHRRENAARVVRDWRKNNPVGEKAHRALNYAIKTGRVSKEPCLFCSGAQVHAHHRDYAKPLEVIWLCPKCHHRLHANFPETEGTHKVDHATMGDV